MGLESRSTMCSVARARVVAIVVGAVLAVSVAATVAPPAQGAIYWTDERGNVGRAANDGSNVDPTFVDGSDTGASLCDVGVAPGFVFWTGTDDFGGHIGRVKTDGTDVEPDRIEPLANAILCGVAGRANGGVFWARTGTFDDAGAGAIGAADASGQIISPALVSGLTASCGPATDGQFVYWGDSPGNVGRATVAGTGVNKAFIPSSGEQLVCGVSTAGGFIYWAYWQAGIGRASADGSNVNRQFINAGFETGGTAVHGEFIYWNDSNGIGRARLDGTQIQEGFIKGVSATGVAVDGVDPVPTGDVDPLDSDPPEASSRAPLAQAKATRRKVRTVLRSAAEADAAARKKGARVRVRCRSKQLAACAGTVGIEGRIRGELRSAAEPSVYRVKSGKKDTVRVKLDRRARRALRRRGQLKARIGVTTRQPADIAAFTKRRGRLVAP